MEMKTNRERLVMLSVAGKIHHPTLPRGGPFNLGHDGVSRVAPGVGGVTYNVRIGDCVYDVAGDHVEPGVSVKNPDERENAAMMALACVGNDAVAVSGDAKGARGFVTGFHGGVEHALVYFPAGDLEKMLPDDRILIRAWGQGLVLTDFPEIMLTGIDPGLLDKMRLSVVNQTLRVPVAARVPAHLMGAGQGMGPGHSGDCDIMTADRAELARRGLERLRYGDLVLIENFDSGFGRGYLTGAVTVGVIAHSDSMSMGHGPGVTTLMTCKRPLIEGVLDENANLARLMGV